MIIYPIDIDFIMSLQVEHIIVHSIHAFDLFVKVIFLFKTTRGLVVPRGVELILGVLSCLQSYRVKI